MRYFPEAMSRDQSNVLLERLIEGFERRGFDFWAVRERSRETLLGFVGLTPVSQATPVDAPTSRSGWRLARHAWGRGIATEAASASLDFAFDELELD